MKPDEPIHKHLFVVTNPHQPESDRCECGTYRYEIMGPFQRRKARLHAYDQAWPVYHR